MNILNKIESTDYQYRDWLLLQAQMQLDYSDLDKAITLLELVESAFGSDITTGLMLCRAWSETGKLAPLEEKASQLLSGTELNREQRAAIYYCLSVTRWRACDRVGARKARKLYTTLISTKR